MALTQEDLQQLGQFIDSRIQGAMDTAKLAQEPQDRESMVGKPDVHPEAGPKYYLHLANGDVIVSHDSASTHVPADDGTTQLVIGRYAMGE